MVSLGRGQAQHCYGIWSEDVWHSGAGPRGVQCRPDRQRSLQHSSVMRLMREGGISKVETRWQGLAAWGGEDGCYFCAGKPA